mgnify:CR=1 FL=1
MSNLTIDFDYIKINLASPERIREWGTRVSQNGLMVGQVRKPETINYKTLKPEMNGLFCEKIFGPIKNLECHCGKYKLSKLNEFLICERCNVEVTESIVRRYRMGFIDLFYPVTHIWYLKGRPSYLSLLLKIKVKALEEIIYFTESLKFQFAIFPNKKIGAEEIKRLLNKINLLKEMNSTRLQILYKNIKLDNKFLRRIRLIENFLATGSQPNWMVLTSIPVIPPGLRPMMQLDGGRFAISDLNELYRRIITRNNRLKKLITLQAPNIIIYNEKRMLQEAIDTLIDNGKHGDLQLNINNRKLKSLSDIIKGKHGRFRENLLGKRVDYSGRSVIIVGPSLKLKQCGLPHEIALKLFEPFIIHKLLSSGYANSVNFAQKLIEKGESNIWTILKTILEKHPILLNRAPTLHRLGIQAFEPILIAGRAIQLHPLVCTAFNADFDGDQMAIHIPLSFEAQTEAKNLMLAPNNFLSPATGESILVPTQDMILGCYYLTVDNPIYNNFKNKYFKSYNDVLLAYNNKKITMHTPVWVKTFEIQDLIEISHSNVEKFQIDDFTKIKYFRTTAGRILLNKTISKNLYR